MRKKKALSLKILKTIYRVHGFWQMYFSENFMIFHWFVYVFLRQNLHKQVYFNHILFKFMMLKVDISKIWSKKIEHQCFKYKKRLLLRCIQWWFVNPDTFVPSGNFRINEFSGLLNRPSPDVRELLINILNCSQLIASFRGIYVALKTAVFICSCFFFASFQYMYVLAFKKAVLLLLFSMFLACKKAVILLIFNFFFVALKMAVLLKEVGDRRLLAAGGWSFL